MAGEARLTRPREAIRALFFEITATGRKFASGIHTPAGIN